MSASGTFGDSPLFLLDYALRLLRVTLLLSVWRILLAGRGDVGGMSLRAVLTYTLIAEVFAEMLSPRTELFSDFWDGRIAMRYLKPLSVFSQLSAEMAGRWLPGLALFSLPLLLAGGWLGASPLPANAGAIVLFVVSLSLAISVGLAIDFLFAGIAVQFGLQVYAIERLRGAIAGLLSGSVIPLALLPWHLGKILDWLPFASVASAPLRLYTGTGDAPKLLGLQLLWALLLWPCARILWERAQEKMVSHGG